MLHHIQDLESERNNKNDPCLACDADTEFLASDLLKSKFR